MQESSTTKQEIKMEKTSAITGSIVQDSSTSAHNVEVFGCNASTLCANTVQ